MQTHHAPELVIEMIDEINQSFNYVSSLTTIAEALAASGTLSALNENVLEDYFSVMNDLLKKMRHVFNTLHSH